MRGRSDAEELLADYRHRGKGIFLVRENLMFPGEYILSFT